MSEAVRDMNVERRGNHTRGGLTPEFTVLLDEADRALDAGGVAAQGRRYWISPGRIEVLGKHVDYAGGRSLLCAIDRGIAVVGRVRDDGLLVVRDARRRQSLTIRIATPEKQMRAAPWAVYPETVVRRLVRNFGDSVRGCDIALASNLPPASGVSSSSALIVGLMLAVASLSDLQSLELWKQELPDRIALAGYAGALENGMGFGRLDGGAGVGTHGGAQDQTAILNCSSGMLDQFSWRPVRHEASVPLPSGLAFVVAVSGVVATKTGAAKARYNRAARVVSHLVEAWNASGCASETASSLREVFEAAWQADGLDGGVPPSLLAVAREAAGGEFSEDQLVRRLHQFHDETWLHVPGATAALKAGDLRAFGDIAEASMEGAALALGNQIPETLSLVRSARTLGARAASAFGAGFGGAVWALVDAEEAADFKREWTRSYSGEFPHRAGKAHAFVTVPSSAAFEII